MLICVFCKCTGQDLLKHCKILHVCVNNQIESSQIKCFDTQQGNSKNVERQHLFRQHLCRWFFKANCASFLRWFLQTLLLACRHVSSILKEEFLVTFQTMALVSFTLHFLSQKSSSNATFLPHSNRWNHDKAITKGSLRLQRECEPLFLDLSAPSQNLKTPIEVLG